jgi:hypothetical protein
VLSSAQEISMSTNLIKRCYNLYLGKSVHFTCVVSCRHSLTPFSESFYSADVVKENHKIVTDQNYTSPDFLSLLNHSGVPVHHLQLKEGCVCTLMRNMSVAKGLVKNARLIVIRLHPHVIQVRLLDNLTGTL